jgi:hypothetical protein
MEELKQEAINILMLAKEIQTETGATFENAMKAIELGERVENKSIYAKMIDFGMAEYKAARDDAKARQEKRDAEQAARSDEEVAAENEALAELNKKTKATAQ